MIKKGLTKYKREKILIYFCEDIEASKTARLTGINRNTVNRYYNILREHILSWQYEEVISLSGEIEVGESYFGARLGRGKRGRGAAGKAPVFGLLERGGKVFVTVAASCSKAALMPTIEEKVLEGSTPSTLAAGRPTTASSSMDTITTESSIARTSSPEARATSTA